jgi:biotin transport system substrate-specific component
MVPCLFAALVALGGFVRVPIPGNPVPLTLQLMFVLLAGASMGPAAAATSMMIFLTAGVFGLPVFAGGAAGLGYLLGPTGGYLIGFVAGAATCALILRGRRHSFVRLVLAMSAATFVVHLFGTVHLALYLGGNLAAATAFDLPFLPGDILKLAVASALAAGSSTLLARRDKSTDQTLRT